MSSIIGALSLVSLSIGVIAMVTSRLNPPMDGDWIVALVGAILVIVGSGGLGWVIA